MSPKRLANGLGEYWWLKQVGEDRVHDHVCDAVRWLDENQRYRSDAILDAVRMYGNYDALGLSGAEYARKRSSQMLRLNVVKAVVDTLTAYIATQKTRPMFLTSKGDYDTQERGKKLNRFSAGQLYGTRFYSKIGPRVFRDAALFGKGWAYNFRRGNEVASERTFPGNILIDDVEAREGEPRQLFHVKEVAREVLYERFVRPAHTSKRAKLERTILDAKLVRSRETSSYKSSLSDPVSIVEAFHIPSGKDAGDGRRSLCLSSGTLEDDEWSRGFPFATMDWTDPLLGFWGHGVVQEIDGIQCEINYVLQKIQRSMTLAASQIWVQKGSKVNTGRMTNDDWAVNEYEGALPSLLAVQSISPEYFSHLDRLWNKAFEIVGVSALAATGKKPGGLNSGEAQREFKETQSQRFLDIEQAYEQLQLNAVEQMIEVAKEIDEDGDGSYAILAKGSRDAELIKWSEVNLDQDKYVLQAYPTNVLPQLPAGRIEKANELAAGFPELKPYLLSILDFPDLDAAVSLVNANLEYIDLLLSQMIDKGEYMPPEALMFADPSFAPLCTQRMMQRVTRAKIDNVPEDRWYLVVRYLNEAKQFLAPPPAPPPTPQLGGAVPPPAPAAMPPDMAMPPNGMVPAAA